MELTQENYYSAEMNKKYCSKSQFASFYGINGCEARAMAEINGEYERPKTDALLLGSYVDCIITEPEQIDKFMADHPEMFSTRGATAGQLKSEFKKAELMAKRLQEDSKAMAYLSGEHQTIMTGEIYGVPFKIKMDSYIPHKAIVDLKTVEALRKSYFHPEKGRCSFVEYFDYILQGAIYQEIVFQNTGERLPFYLVCVSKESNPNKELIYIDDESMHNAIYGSEFGGGIAEQLNNIRLLKNGELEPRHCGECDYCIPLKQITKPIHYTELLGEI